MDLLLLLMLRRRHLLVGQRDAPGLQNWEPQTPLQISTHRHERWHHTQVKTPENDARPSTYAAVDAPGEEAPGTPGWSGVDGTIALGVDVGAARCAAERPRRGCDGDELMRDCALWMMPVRRPAGVGLIDN